MKRILAIIAALPLFCACPENNKPQEQTAPAVPAGVTLHRATETSLTFKWTPVEGATTYGWRLVEGTTEADKGSTSSRSVEITNLKKATTYKFYVRSISAAGNSDWSAPLEATTEGSETPDPGTDPVDPPVDPSYYEEFAIPAHEEDGAARAFPGAEGGGMWVTGGRGGKVLHVTSLEDSNSEGTLRWAVTQNYARTIVFDVAGIISLTSALVVNRDNVTIAGQTAPGDGICLRGNTFRIAANNAIVRFIRCRMGDETGVENDAMQVMNGDGDKYSGIIIDHCSTSWSTDECASFYGMKDFTFQWNIVSESLRQSLHEKGAHGYGGIWGGTNATYHHNLLAHHDSRNPRIDHDYVSPQKGPVSIVNNVVYNWKGNTCYGGESSSGSGGGYRKYNFVGNYYKPGPATPSNHIWFIEPTTSCSNCSKTYSGSILPGHFYMTGNVMYGHDALTGDNWSTVHGANASVIAQIKESGAFDAEKLSLHSAQAAFDAVTAYAGASFARDAIDTRIAKETQDGTATYTGSAGKIKGLIDTQNDVGGWPQYKGEASNDSDSDGMPDWFEQQFGLGKSNPADASQTTLDKNGRYTNLEMYLHYIVKDIVNAGNANSNYTKL
jgi:hypothetical protein